MVLILLGLFTFSSSPIQLFPGFDIPTVVTYQDKLERNAEFPGGLEALSAFIIQNISYPKEARENKIQGRVYVSFVIDTDGSVIDVNNAVPSKIIGYGIEEEAIRVVSIMPAWTPGLQNGKTVKVRYTLPIYFSLD